MGHFSSKTVKDIKDEFAQASMMEFSTLLDKYNSDNRKGVKTLCKQYKRRLDEYYAELARIDTMSRFDRQYYSKGIVCGIDEVGRGPLAGPVVACAVILPKDCNILYINDSKKLSEKKRESVYDEIISTAVAYGIGIVEADVIDELNIYQATKKAFEDALSGINVPFDIVLTDAMKINTVHPYDPLIKGDARSLSIAAASILAKVTRDEIMIELDKKYPHYDFKRNKGYPTKKHLEALETYGPIKGVHRFSYKPVAKTQYQQLKLF